MKGYVSIGLDKQYVLLCWHDPKKLIHKINEEKLFVFLNSSNKQLKVEFLMPLKISLKVLNI